MALDNEAICLLLFVKDNHCGGWVGFDDLTEQFSQSACTSVPASFVWRIVTRWQSPSLLEVSCPSEMSTLTTGLTLIVQAL